MTFGVLGSDQLLGDIRIYQCSSERVALCSDILSYGISERLVFKFPDNDYRYRSARFLHKVSVKKIRNLIDN